MHYLFFETTVEWQVPTFVRKFPLFWLLDKGYLPRGITAWNYLNVLEAADLQI